MNGGRTARCVVVVAALALTPAAFGQAPGFTPPRIARADLPAMPPPTIVGGGEVIIEGIVDVRGALTRPLVVRSTPPYTQAVLEAAARWQFEPARARDDKGIESPVEMPISISAVFRPPALTASHVLGEPPRDFARPSGDVAAPVELVMPAYPVDVLHEAIVMYEVSLDESGRVAGLRSIGAGAGFERVASAALLKTQFRPGTHRARPVPSTAFIVYGFRSPTSNVPPCIIPQCAPPPPPR